MVKGKVKSEAACRCMEGCGMGCGPGVLCCEALFGADVSSPRMSLSRYSFSASASSRLWVMLFPSPPTSAELLLVLLLLLLPLLLPLVVVVVVVVVATVGAPT